MANGQAEQYEYGFAKMEFMDELIAARIIFGLDNAEPLLGVGALEEAGFLVYPTNQTLRRVLVFPLKTITAAQIELRLP